MTPERELHAHLAAQERERRYAEAIDRAPASDVPPPSQPGWLIWINEARAVVAVADAEQVAWVATIDELHASVIEMGEYVKQAEAERDRARNTAARLEQECARLSETVAGLTEQGVEWGIQRPEPYEGVIGDLGNEATAKRSRDLITASHEGEWHVVRRRRYVSEWERAALTGPTETGDEPA